MALLKATPALRAKMAELYGQVANTTDDDGVLKLAAQAIKEGKLKMGQVAQLCSTPPKAKKGATVTTKTTPTKGGKSSPTATKGFGAPSTPSKSGQPWAKLSKEKKPLLLRGGQPFRIDEGEGTASGQAQRTKTVCLPSELEYAKVAVWLRHLGVKQGMPFRPLNQAERYLLDSMIAEDQWHGSYSMGDDLRTFDRMEVKTLLDETGTSGGRAINPIWFDDAIISFPVLHSELMPYVDVKDVPRSSRVESGSINNPSIVSGPAEGTAATAFDTAGLVAAVNTSIYPATCLVKVGRDYLSDAGVDVGAKLVEMIGEKFKQWIDEQIAVGDGTTEPTGLTGATGTIAVSSDNGPSGPPSVGDLESLYFAVPKAYRAEASWNPRFVMTDTTYRRFRSLPVGPTDERRLMGMGDQGTPGGTAGLGSYQLYGMPVSISPNFTNSQAMFLPLKKCYRLYRRQGYEMRWTIEGQTLALENTALLVVRGRFGGRVVDPTGMAYCQELQS